MRNRFFRLILFFTFLIGVLFFSIPPVTAEENAAASEIDKARQEGFTAGLAAGEYIRIFDHLYFYIPFAEYKGAMAYCEFDSDGLEWELKSDKLVFPGKTVVVTKENDGETVKLEINDILHIKLISEFGDGSRPYMWGISNLDFIYYLSIHRDVFKPHGDDISWSSSGEAIGGGPAVHELTLIAAVQRTGQLIMELHPAGLQLTTEAVDTFTINVEVE